MCITKDIFPHSISEINSTFQSTDDTTNNNFEDVLYQKGASFSAKLDNSQNVNTNNNIDDNDTSGDDDNDSFPAPSISPNKSDDSIARNNHQRASNELSLFSDKIRLVKTKTQRKRPLPAKQSVVNRQSPGVEAIDNRYYPINTNDNDMSVFDDVDNNVLNLRSTNQDEQLLPTGDQKQSVFTVDNSSSKSYIHIEVYRGNLMNENSSDSAVPVVEAKGDTSSYGNATVSTEKMM